MLIATDILKQKIIDYAVELAQPDYSAPAPVTQARRAVIEARIERLWRQHTLGAEDDLP